MAMICHKSALSLSIVMVGNCTTSYGLTTACQNAGINMENNTYSYETVCQNLNSNYPYSGIVKYGGYQWLVCYSGNEVAIAPTVYQASQTVQVAVNAVYTNGTASTITNSGYYDCLFRQSCADDAYWVSSSAGVQYKRSGRTCPTSGTDSSACVGGTTSYRCASGYYGYSSSGVPTCTSCATTGFSNATSIAGDNSDITKCYLPVASYMDTVGKFDITGTYCNYSLDDGYDDRIVPLACSEMVAMGCSLPSVGHECYAAYSRANSGDLVCIDCSALDKDGLKMINTCYKD